MPKRNQSPANQSPDPNSGSMTNLAYAKIKELILTNRLFPGQKLLYADLEDRLRMSKTPIISALNKLESDGYVYLKRNSGYYIKEINREEIVQVYAARELLEIANIDNVVANCTNAELEELKQIHAEYAKYLPEVFDRKKSLLNSQFHVQMARMGKNAFVVKYIEHIYEWIDLRLRFHILPGWRVIQSTSEHEDILRAVCDRDKKKTKMMLRRHLRKPARLIIENLAREDGAWR